MASGFEEVFNSLAGEWFLRRSISSGECLQGRATISHAGTNRLFVSEEGDLRLADGGSVPASRNWVWRFEEGSLEIFFDEEPLRLYHEVELIAEADCWRGEASHDCPPDIYRGEYLFRHDAIMVEQTVLGPRKDYRIISEFSRIRFTQNR